jgi:hypothetical protein
VLNAGGKLFEGNGSQFYCDWRGYNFPSTAVTTITQGDSGGFFSFSNHDGCFREFWAIPKTCVVEGGFDSPTVCASAQFKMAKELTSHGHFARFMMRASYDDPQYGPSTLYHDRDRMFTLAYCAMVAGPNSYGGYMPVGAISPPESTQWWPAVGYDFGTPQSDSIYTFQTGTDSKGEAYVIYARYFTKGLVLLKPKPHYNSDLSETGSPVTVVNLPVALRRLNVDGTLGPLVTQVSLKNIEAAIMIGSVTPSGGGGGGLDTIPPTPTTVAYTFRVDDSSPANQSIAPSHTNIKVNLNDVIDKATVTASTVQATGSVSGAHPGAISAVGRYLTFTPSTPFSINEVVTVRVSATLRSITGHNLDGDGDGQGGGDKVWTFTVSDH